MPLADVLIRILQAVEHKLGTAFDGTNLRKIWHKACAAAGFGTLTEVEGKPDPRYTGLIIHDLRRSAIRNLMKAGTSEKVAMTNSGHKMRDVFDRYHIVDTQDVVEAMRRVRNGPVSHSENTVKRPRVVRRQKLLTA